MKTLLTYVLVASMGLITTYSFAYAQEERVDYVTSLESLPLENDDFATVPGNQTTVIGINSQYWFRKKQSLLYYINTSEAIDIATGQKDDSKKLVFGLRIPLNPDKAEPSGLFLQDTNSQNALMIDVTEIKVTTMGEYQLSPNAKASIKLPFIKQGIGEYHLLSVGGTFAVFR